jgi:hypothetical protein
MNDREQRGLAIAALFRIDKKDGKYIVPSQTRSGERYEVAIDNEYPTCSCPDYRDRAIKCKHMFAVEFALRREFAEDGSVTLERSITVRERVTYKQDWPAYNAAQTNEKRRFLELLAELCRGVPEFEREPGKAGRPRMCLADALFAVVFKIYSTLGARRFMCDLADAEAKGYIGKAHHFNTMSKCLDKTGLTPILRSLIAETSKPLASIESEFAVDSSGFSTSRFDRWFDMKYGKTMTDREWVKVHLMCGVKTNTVTAVEILDKHAGDSPLLPPLVNATAKNFTIKEVSADKAYSSQQNLECITRVGAVPYVAFKENATGAAGGIFQKSFHYYNLKRDEFLSHYHKRSNVESTFSMIKAKFGDSIRSRTDTAMTNEVLCKVLCHNICCLIQSIYELKIEPTFWGRDEAKQVAFGSDSVDALAWI